MCGVKLQCRQKNLGPGGVSSGVCQPLINANEQCELNDEDGVRRSYECLVGYKCVTVPGSDFKKCKQKHSLLDGEASNDGDLCESGWAHGGRCLSVVGVGRGGRTFEAPYRCDLGSSTTCEARLSDGSWVNFGACQCSLEDANSSFCKFPGELEWRSQFILYRKAAEDSQFCDPRVVNNRIWHEWESCTSDLDLVL